MNQRQTQQRTGKHERRFEIKDCFKRKSDGTWLSLDKATFNRNNEMGSENYTNANDAGISIDGVFYFQNGGATTPSYTKNSPISLTCESTSETPVNARINFTIDQVSTTGVAWMVPTSSTPQFKYTILVDGAEIESITDPEARSASITIAEGSVVQVVLEDILGRTTTKT